jgi:hypothetical protein
MSNPLRNPLGMPSLSSRHAPLQPRVESSSPKRGRSNTTANPEPQLPPNRRHKTKPLKATQSFMFTGVHPLYRRELIKGDNEHMTIYCNFPGCTTYKPKVVPRALHDTNNYKFHYHSQHPGVPCSLKEKALKDAANPQGKKPFF